MDIQNKVVGFRPIPVQQGLTVDIGENGLGPTHKGAASPQSNQVGALLVQCFVLE